MTVSISYHKYSLSDSFGSSFTVIHLDMDIDSAIDYVYDILKADCLVSCQIISE